jgi:hypothetical protein
MRGIRAAILLAAAGLFIGPALAQQPTQAQANAIKQACRADYQAHCASVPTGGSAALSCLQQNASSLSAGCQTALSAISGSDGGGNAGGGATAAAPPPPPASAAPQMSGRQEVRLMREACGPDYRAYCSGVRPGGGRAIACLEAHGRSLSHQCRSALMAARQSR